MKYYINVFTIKKIYMLIEKQFYILQACFLLHQIYTLDFYMCWAFCKENSICHFFFRLISLSKVLHVYMFELNFCCELLWYKMYAGILTCTEGQAFVQMKGFNDSIAIICKWLVQYMYRQVCYPRIFT